MLLFILGCMAGASFGAAVMGLCIASSRAADDEAQYRSSPDDRFHPSGR